MLGNHISTQLICLVVVLVSTLTGCGDSDPYAVVPVSGTLTYEGEPVSGVRMKFVPAEGRSSIAVTDGQGKFRALYRAGQFGVQKGSVTVVLESNDSGGSVLGEETKADRKVAELLRQYGHGGDPVEIQIDGEVENLEINLKKKE